MFKKNNLKYILILGIGFLWCSSVYLNQEKYLLNYMLEFNVYIVDMVIGSFMMAIGIYLFSLLYKKKKDVKKIYNIFMIICIISLLLFYVFKSNIALSIILCLVCMIGTAGFGTGYHFSLVADKVETKYRGRVFAIGYSIGIVGTYLLSLLPNNIMVNSTSLLVHIPLILLCMYLINKYGNISSFTKPEGIPNNIKCYKYTLFILIICMSLVTSFTSNYFALNSIMTKEGFAYSRLYYSIGLLIAGIVADYKSREYTDLLAMISLFYSLLAILLLKENVSSEVLYCLNYLFLGFFVIFRTITFMNLKDKSKSMIFLAGYGLLLSRICEGVLALSDIFYKKDYLFYVLASIFLIVITLIIYVLRYHKITEKTDVDIIKELSVKFSLSIQEQKILNLLVRGYSNQQIADELFLSINTVKTHVGNIYKKTGKKKNDLQAELLLIKNN